jgi:Ca2+-binding RTX toxin-like protein
MVRKAMLLCLGVVLTSLLVAGGVAWAKQKVIQCRYHPDVERPCFGTPSSEVILGTGKYDLVRAGDGMDTVYGRGGDDDLSGGGGPDKVYGGPGDDWLSTDCDWDYWCGEDTKYGGRGNDSLGGNLRSERHFGGRGNDYFIDYKSSKHPDVFHCGRGRDEVLYNKGFDKVAKDCEILKPAPKRYVLPYA